MSQLRGAFESFYLDQEGNLTDDTDLIAECEDLLFFSRDLDRFYTLGA